MGTPRRAHGSVAATLLTAAALLVAVAPAIGAQAAARAAAAAPAGTVAPPTATYWTYVGAESKDEVYRLRFGPDGALVERTIYVGELAAEMEGPHGLQISRDGRYLHMTTGHGFPDGKYWVYVLGPDTLMAPGILLGNFPASLDVTPDGRYMFSVNFNLHGDMVPSSVSVVYVPTMTQVARVVTCTMPHGSRISPDGTRQYSGCMMDDEVVEIDTKSLAVARRFSVRKGKEGPVDAAGEHLMLSHWIAGAREASGGRSGDPADVGYLAMPGMQHAMTPNTCSPTWVQPSSTGARIYVACNKGDEILELDRDAWAISRRFKTGRGPYNLAVTPDGKLLVATLKQGSKAEIFDLASGSSLAQVATSNTLAHGVTISSDSRYAFVSSEGVGAQPGKVDVFDLAARQKVATIDVGQQPSGITFWKMEPARK
ncbi:MAG: YncE family protein [Gemmatimonadota bacterium]|nr:YncE family protein [Gemmatimonadota bacterium]